ncbi:MAG: HAD family phosphatase [Ignavibacteria bacterium]|nr:HAD family phosphatase [Ignavibacteria bacterium]
MSRRDIEWIFWDNDGVLVDTERYYFEATKTVLASVGVELTEQQYQDLFLRQAVGAWHYAKERGFTDEEVKDLRRRRFNLYTELVQGRDTKLPGVTSVLRELKDRYRHAIVTSSRRHHFDVIHQSTGLLPFFDFVLAREDYSLSKPDPEPYLKALERADVKPDNALVIEDSERGLTAAVAAGIRCWITPSHFTEGFRFEGADRILNGIEEIPALLLAD